MVFQDAEVQQSLLNQESTVQNEQIAQNEANQLINQIEEQNLNLVNVLTDVRQTTHLIKISGDYAAQKCNKKDFKVGGEGSDSDLDEEAKRQIAMMDY